jgi:hypothetical protein
MLNFIAEKKIAQQMKMHEGSRLMTKIIINVKKLN